MNRIGVGTDPNCPGAKPSTTGNSSPRRFGASCLSEDEKIIGLFKDQFDDINIWDVIATTVAQILDLFNKELKSKIKIIIFLISLLFFNS